MVIKCKLKKIKVVNIIRLQNQEDPLGDLRPVNNQNDLLLVKSQFAKFYDYFCESLYFKDHVKNLIFSFLFTEFSFLLQSLPYFTNRSFSVKKIFLKEEFISIHIKEHALIVMMSWHTMTKVKIFYAFNLPFTILVM